MEAKLKSPYNSLTVIHQFMCCGPDSGNEIQIGDFFSLWGSTLSDFGLKMAHSLSKGYREVVGAACQELPCRCRKLPFKIEEERERKEREEREKRFNNVGTF